MSGGFGSGFELVAVFIEAARGLRRRDLGHATEAGIRAPDPGVESTS